MDLRTFQACMFHEHNMLVINHQKLGLLDWLSSGYGSGSHKHMCAFGLNAFAIYKPKGNTSITLDFSKLHTYD